MPWNGPRRSTDLRGVYQEDEGEGEGKRKGKERKSRGRKESVCIHRLVNSCSTLRVSTHSGTLSPLAAYSPNSIATLMTSDCCLRALAWANDLCLVAYHYPPFSSRRRPISTFRYSSSARHQSPHIMPIRTIHSQSTAPIRFSSQPIAASSSRSSSDARKP
ncbi:hypothetical protein EI94DRAFT_1755250 [Lactarius quietus]|nr:hypothetical protein EI94DRAFT_1755250 [Lactarius quietus]